MKEVAVIMAGGYGERFWPMSRISKPKQLLKIFSDNSMIRETFLRVNSFLSASQIFIVTGKEHQVKIANDIPEMHVENFIIEPCRRDTAAAIALSAIYVEKRYPGAVMLICAADHLIKDIMMFRNIITNAFKIAKSTSCLLTLGITPSRIETAYGYIEIGDLISQESSTEAYEVKQFIEKPNYTKAAQYIEMKTFLWNSGMFIWETQTLLEEISKYLPEHYSGMLEIGEFIGSRQEENIKEKVFETLPKISIDYGIMEKSKNILCIKTTFQWDDIGSWSSIYRCLNTNEDNNIQSGQVLTVNTKDSIILGDNSTLIGVVGVKDLIIIKTRDALLICNKNDDQKVKDLVKMIEKNESLNKFL
ncbi:MAG: mannose-1-phosphate guanylyltransferase [Spirochaetota bacterium]|nr:mannose-1-phosphate guanylyltransferase [Spirochaetota bacterium]